MTTTVVIRNDMAAKRRAAMARHICRLVLQQGYGVDDARLMARSSALEVWGALRQCRPDSDPWVRLARRRAHEEASGARP